MNDPTLKDLFDRAWQTHFYRLSYCGKYGFQMKQLLDFFGIMPLGNLTSLVIEEFKGSMTKRGYAPGTVNRHLAVLHKSLTLAKEWNWINHLPVIHKLTEPPGRDKWLTREEEDKLLEASAPWLRPLILTAIYTGMRLSEILNLEWANIDLGQRLIMVVRSKNKERRSIPIHDKLHELFARRARESNFVFCSRTKRRLTKFQAAAVSPVKRDHAVTTVARTARAPKRSASAPDGA